MVPFQIEIEWQNTPVNLIAEQLDNLADEEGYIRFDVRNARRRAVIFVGMEHQPPILENSQGQESHFESLHYSQQYAAFSFDETFVAGEIVSIGRAIREHFAAGYFLSGAQTLLL
jgi:hypothetical protein